MTATDRYNIDDHLVAQWDAALRREATRLPDGTIDRLSLVQLMRGKAEVTSVPHLIGLARHFGINLTGGASRADALRCVVDGWIQKERRADAPAPTPPVDHFAEDRAILERVLGALREREPVVTLGEWWADRVLGDPLLRPAMQYAAHARETLLATETFVRLAIDALPKPEVTS